MWCCEYLVRNFKNLLPHRIQWDPGLNLITGRNGAGKTNCLEGLHLLTGWGPFGARRDIPQWGNEERPAYVTGSFCGEEDLFMALVTGATTVMKCDGKRVSYPEVRARAPSLAFLPSHMALLDGPPSVRRNFMDNFCALLFPLYARWMGDYRRGVRHKTALLREGKNPKGASRAMAPLAARLWSSRDEAIGLLSLGLSSFPGLLPEPLELRHKRGGSLCGGDPLHDWRSSVEARSVEEGRSGLCLVGPHRDDLLIQSGGREGGVFFSRGQKRRAGAALMMAAARAVEARLKRKPLVIIDEIASELDREGREITFESLNKTGWQVIAASAELDEKEWPGVVWRAEEGAILPCIP